MEGDKTCNSLTHILISPVTTEMLPFFLTFQHLKKTYL